MVRAHLAGRGISDPRVLDAFRQVRREGFLPPQLAEFAYEDTSLPIGRERTISQPYILALTLQALGLRGSERVLEVGTGSGYTAALLGCLAKTVWTVERVAPLVDSARERLQRLGYWNVHVLEGDGSLGWPAGAPYDAIAVAASGPEPPAALLAQLALGGRLVMPVGGVEDSQTLVRVTRLSEAEYREEWLADVQFVPVAGGQGRSSEVRIRGAQRPSRPAPRLPKLVREAGEPIDDIERASLDSLIDRIGDARLVLLGEASHGTREFQRMRARITRELILRRGFRFVAIGADWPDAACVNDYVRGRRARSKGDFVPFGSFPTWMWQNEEVEDFVDWLRAYNADHVRDRVGFHGLDRYSLFASIRTVLSHLDQVDPVVARAARHRYGALTLWQKNPAAYGEAALPLHYVSSEQAVVNLLCGALARRIEGAQRDGEPFFDAAQDARCIAHAELFYRSLYYGRATWNLRDGYMFDTLRSLLAFYGQGSKAIVWAHNSHVGDVTATEMGARGDHNLGAICRAAFGEDTYIVGFGTDHGTVAAAERWGAPVQPMSLSPSIEGSYERVFHESGVPAFALPLANPRRPSVRDELAPALLERAIGIVNSPDMGRWSQYFHAVLPRQFDELIWFDETSAIDPLGSTARSYADGMESLDL